MELTNRRSGSTGTRLFLDLLTTGECRFRRRHLCASLLTAAISSTRIANASPGAGMWLVGSDVLAIVSALVARVEIRNAEAFLR
jgi:hypothetical protein